MNLMYMILLKRKGVISRICSPLVLASLLFLSFPCNLTAQDAGQPGEFLRYGVGARALGMGRAFIAIADDVSAIYWNPGGIIRVERKEFTSMYTNLFYDSRYTYFAIAIPRLYPRPKRGLSNFFLGPASAWGFAWVNLTTGDFDQRTEYNIPLGNFDIYEQALFISFAREWVNTWGIFNYGGNFKLVNQGFSGLVQNEYSGISGNKTKDWGTGLDFGITIEPINFPVLRIIPLRYLLPFKMGFNIQNLWQPKIRLGKATKDTYPKIYRGGLSYKYNIRGWKILTAYDQERCPGRDVGHYGGVEVNRPFWNLMPCLRLGFNNRTDAFTIGGGIKQKLSQNIHLQLDYAFGDHPGLGSSGGDSRISMTIAFGEHYGPDYFYKRALATDKSEKKRAYLHILAKYPNEKATESAESLAVTYDPANEGRYWDLVGGIGKAEWLFRKAKNHLKKGNHKKARAIAEKAIVEYAKEFNKPEVEFGNDTLLNFGEALMIVDRWDDAIKVTEEVEPPSLRYYYQIGVCHQNLRKWDDAADEFRQAISCAQDEKSMRCLSFLGLGGCLKEKRSYRSAIDTLNVIVRNYHTKLDPDYPRYPIYKDNNIVDDAQYLIGECFLNIGNKEEALKAFAKIPRFYPDSDKSEDGIVEMQIEKLIREILE